MREILFRGKAINRENGYHRTRYKNGDWVYGLVTKLYDERFENLPAEMANTDGVTGIEIDYKTISQYTGLTDKNGKKIFEGDIVRSCVGTYVVKYLTGAWFCSLIECEYLTLLCTISAEEVIGNIHDNPELLKGVNDNG